MHKWIDIYTPPWVNCDAPVTYEESNGTTRFSIVIFNLTSQCHSNFEGPFLVKKPSVKWYIVLLNTNGKSHMRRPTVPKDLTLSDLERSNPRSLRFWSLVSRKGVEVGCILSGRRSVRCPYICRQHIDLTTYCPYICRQHIVHIFADNILIWISQKRRGVNTRMCSKHNEHTEASRDIVDILQISQPYM